MAHVRLAAPLPLEARRMVLGRRRRVRELLGERLAERDRDALDVLVDEGHPPGIMQRPGTRLRVSFLEASRHIHLARAA
jgi:hypothetical protein